MRTRHAQPASKIIDISGKINTHYLSKVRSLQHPMTACTGETRWVLLEDFFEKTALVESFIAAGDCQNLRVNSSQWDATYFECGETGERGRLRNRPIGTKYLYMEFDSAGQRFHGRTRYTITFAKASLPPARGSWSLTTYSERLGFDADAWNRFSLGTGNTDLKYNADGSLTLYASVNSPATDKKSNWLHAPNGTFSLFLRAHWSDQSILEGSWTPPVVEIMKEASGRTNCLTAIFAAGATS